MVFRHVLLQYKVKQQLKKQGKFPSPRIGRKAAKAAAGAPNGGAGGGGTAVTAKKKNPVQVQKQLERTPQGWLEVLGPQATVEGSRQLEHISALIAKNADPNVRAAPLQSSRVRGFPGGASISTN
jgi:hypothetical protein